MYTETRRPDQIDFPAHVPHERCYVCQNPSHDPESGLCLNAYCRRNVGPDSVPLAVPPACPWCGLAVVGQGAPVIGDQPAHPLCVREYQVWWEEAAGRPGVCEPDESDVAVWERDRAA